MQASPTTLDESAVKAASAKISELQRAVNAVILGQEVIVELVMIALLSRGHVLLEGLPGLGKTELVKTFSQLLDMDSGRVQFTPDILPGDITGNPMLEEIDGRRRFVFQQGPIFTHLLLADEINRASPKTQSALLEAMQESRVTVVGKAHLLPKPFFVFATQNPIELEGTYPLPEAQLDRFLFKLVVTRTTTDVLDQIIQARFQGAEVELKSIMNRDTLLDMIEMAQSVYLPPVVSRYIARLVSATHPDEGVAGGIVKYGASPRAAIGMAAAARARALIHGRVHTSSDDVKAVAPYVLGHRIVLNYQARMEGRTTESFVKELLDVVSPEETILPRSLSTAKLG